MSYFTYLVPSLHLSPSLCFFFFFFFPSLGSSAHHLPARSSHSLRKQLGFLNSRLWQSHTAHLSRQRDATTWAAPLRRCVIVLCAASAALAHLPLGRVNEIKVPSSPCKAKRDCQIWAEQRGGGTGSLIRLKGSMWPTVMELKRKASSTSG